MSPDGEDLTNNQLLLYYGEVCRSHGTITDFRAKLLALLPIASATGIGLLLAQASGDAAVPAWLFAPIGAFGALVTVGLFLYEFHQMDDCQQLRNHGVWIERRLGLKAGQFSSKRGDLERRHIWPATYSERDEALQAKERAGEEPPPSLRLGFVSVRTADYIVYGTVFLAWFAVLAWGIKGLIELG